MVKKVRLKLTKQSLLITGFTILALVICAVMYTWNISEFVHGFNKVELESVNLSQVIDINYLVDAPYHSLQKLSLTVFGESSLGVRAASVAVGLVSVILFYHLLRQLTNKRISLLATAMFATSSWMLTISRLGSPIIMNILWPIAILLIAYNVYQRHMSWYWYIIAGSVLGLAAYTPRMIIFVIFAIIVAIAVFHRYDASMHKAGALSGLAVFILFISPLIYSLVIAPSQIQDLIAIPKSVPGVSGIVDNTLSAVSNIGWNANLPSYLNLGNLPLLDIATLTFAALGLIVIFTDLRAPRGWLLLSIIASGAVVITLTPLKIVNVFFALPTISILSGIGLFTLWTHWREFFPKNVAARGLALSLLSLVVLFSMSYNFERYFFAWSRVPETQAAFSDQLD